MGDVAITWAHWRAVQAALATCRADQAVAVACNRSGRYRHPDQCPGTNGHPHELATGEQQIARLVEVAGFLEGMMAKKEMGDG
jgi:hypothetical protein